MQTPAKQKLLFFAIIFFASTATLRASDGPADSDSWDSDLQSSLDSISETPAQPEPSADADLTQESSSEDAPSPTETESSQDKTRYAVPPTISEPAGSAGNSTPPKSMVQPSSDSMIQRKAADLRGRVERLEDRIAQNERDIHSLSERVDTLRRSFDEFRRRR